MKLFVFTTLLIIQEVVSAPPCLPCDPGFGVKSECNRTHPTVCQPCKAGETYARLRSFFTPCKTCSVCGPYTFMMSACTTTADAACISCFSALPPGAEDNPDYHRKCLGEQTVDTRTEQGVIVTILTVDSPTNKHEVQTVPAPHPRRRRSSDGAGASEALSLEWDGVSGLGPIPDEPIYPVTFDSSSEFPTDMRDENLMPGLPGDMEGLPPGFDWSSIDPETLAAYGFDMGSGIPPGMDPRNRGTIKKEVEENRMPIHEEERLNEKQAKTGIIVASVVAGAVTSILGCFLVCRLRRRRRERCHKNGNVFVEAPIGHRPDIEVVGADLEDDEEAGPAMERRPLATANGHVPHAPPDDDGHYELPIDIRTPDVVLDRSLKKKPLKLGYVPESDPEITNTGDTVQIKFKDERSVISGGPLGSRSYRLSHCHFHWGSRDCQGSEHTVNGCSYPGELHLVHCETDKSSKANNARPGRAVAILAVFLEVQAEDEHDALALIVNKLGLVQYKGESTRMSPAKFDPSFLLPADCSKYWTYTSECSSQAAVSQISWILFRHPIEISSLQLESFRQLRCNERGEDHGNDEEYLVDNFRRPLAPPGEFAVTSSF